MNHNMLPAVGTIPLHCNICPKKPDFSDVSHLLTHIASKGHLSHYYKMKVKASTDPDSREIVDEYDDWYETWNVQDLMMERMSQKEKKKSGSNSGSNSRRGSGANSVASVNSRNTSLSVNLATRRSLAFRENTLDPQLGPIIKEEPKSRSTTPLPPFSRDPAAMHRSYAPPMRSWPTTPYEQSPVGGSLYSTPSSNSPDFDLPKHEGRRSSLKTNSLSNPSFGDNDPTEFDDGMGEASKLKGVLWEGMGMFDSATPDMRRKRNQKKETSVIQQLMATSEVVEAEECVFDTEGELRRKRPITGNPESDDGMSSLQGETTPEPEFPPPKKKAGRRPRAALTDKNANTTRVTRRRGESHHPPFNNRNKRAPYFDGPSQDNDLTYGRSRPKKRTGLSIHCDNSGPDITFDHPAPLTTLTSTFRNPFHTAPLWHHGEGAYQNGFVNRGHQRQPSIPYGGGFRSTNSNPLNIPPPNFGSFGQLSGQSMFQNAAMNGSNPFQLPNVQQGFAGLPHPFSGVQAGQQALGTESSGFQSQISAPWDMFGFGCQDMSMHSAMDAGFPANGEFTTVNPLFFSSNNPVPEDDEATVSPPNSQN